MSVRKYVPNINFRVHIVHNKMGVIECGFFSMAGLNVNAEMEQKREGGNNKLPDNFVQSISIEPVTLTKGTTKDEVILELASKVFDSPSGVISPFSELFQVTIEQLDRMGETFKKYELEDCILNGVAIGEINSVGMDIHISSITLTPSSVSIN